MSKREATNIENVQEMLNKNDEIIRSIKNINDQYMQEIGIQRKAIIITYGCAMNEHDSEKINAMLTDMGYMITKNVEESDLVIFNTCCVRENAELRVYGNLGRIKKLKETRKDLKLAVCGCMMQQPHVVEEIKKKYKYVDLVFGTHNLHNFPTLLEETLVSKKQVVEVWDSQGEVVEGLSINREKQLKGFVNIMYGCNNFCTYCIVPYTRGRERSRKPEDIVSEIKALVKNGTREIMLLGQNVNSYDDHESDFADLLEKVAHIEGLWRIRFMTSHPKDITQKLLEVMSKYENICKSLHLPLQSGSDNILKAMNRNYTKAQYLEIVKRARDLMPSIGLSTDLIVGFPGETEEDFLETIDVIKKVNFDSAFTYLYSIRTGTPAAKLEQQVEESVKSERMQRLLAVLNPMVGEKMKLYQDQTIEVLVESFSKSSNELMMGRNSQGITVNFKGDETLIGERVNVKIHKPKQFSLMGEIV